MNPNDDELWMLQNLATNRRRGQKWHQKLMELWQKIKALF
ncbi:hypothetical protein MC7420_6986 [Coleofasciculus chthonoplastes PCC 7420]|uniref:Uncharacterized protein n=1 Tax=Coleofasciculus chthonoplastes PCC 7420 TaxID=118168 RepID=B4VHH8_9CYAN|nr:hypothetical protein MC7420_6986 [Coleofasciculus chthonoplastes PCC 7420]